MSTEARHAPIPPRPTRAPAPAPRPAATAASPAGVFEEQPGRSGGGLRAPATGGARDHGTDPGDGSGTAGHGRRPNNDAAPGEPLRGETAHGRAGHTGAGRAPDPRVPAAPGAAAAAPPAPAPHTGGAPRPTTPPPPPASARFPDAPPTVGRRPSAPAPGAPAAPAGPGAQPAPSAGGAPAESTSETTARLRPVAAHHPAEPGPRAPHAVPGPTPPHPPAATARTAVAPDPGLSWSAATTTGAAGAAARPVVSLGLPEGYDARGRGRALAVRGGPRTAAAAACVVLGIGLIGGAVTGSWLTDDSGPAGAGAFATAGTLWHSVPVDRLFPPTVQGPGAGPGGADRTWTRVAVAPDGDCADAFDPLLRKALAPVGCARLLRATYTDATQTYVTTVGLLFTKADAAAMGSLAARFRNEGLARRTDLMPRPYAAPGTVAASFGDKQRASWTISVLTRMPVVVYAVSGWADGRGVDTPQPAADAMRSGATTAPAQAGLGNEAEGLADRIGKALRTTAGTATEKPS
ncbi:hypothetical protein [Streptomyces mexicanus]|uniref:hypothetical protein n=1 Tax=Streptomyces mexicanus TaxID=178566 RepID=UPI003646AC9F